MMIRRYGDEFWVNVLARTGFEMGKENIVNHYYPDADTYALVDSVSALSSEFFRLRSGVAATPESVSESIRLSRHPGGEM